jgi:beta-lactamase class C
MLRYAQEMKFASPLMSAILCALLVTPSASDAADAPRARVRKAVDDAIQPLMAKDNIPGMAVAITIAGKSSVFNYGVASTEIRKPVTADTMFEIGSVTKTFTATLTSWAQVNNHLSLSDKVDNYLPSLRNTPFGNLSLLNLGTHTSGGLPLQLPGDVRNDDQLMQYLKAWRPSHPPGTYRTYANPGIGLLGVITAKSMGQDFVALMEQHLFPALGMTSSFINVPANRMTDYAQGYTTEGKPVRMSAGVLSSEAYGIKSTAADLIHFVEANMNLLKLDGKLLSAITNTHTGYFQAGVMTQDLIWEQYRYPVELKALLEGNSSTMIFNANPVTEIKPAQAPQQNVWINKTGSTNGFAAYVAFIPEKRLGIVILANKSYPIEERVVVAYKILTSFAKN